jgi:hypothetical protein
MRITDGQAGIRDTPERRRVHGDRSKVVRLAARKLAVLCDGVCNAIVLTVFERRARSIVRGTNDGNGASA